MKPTLKPLRDQVIVITGASSGIGLTTARMAAKRGATVVLSLRNEDALRHIASDLADKGHKVSFVVADTARETDMRNLAERALEQHVRVDSWINNAAVPLYGELLTTPLQDQRQLFDINYWGVVHGSLAGVGIMSRNGGALINIGSILSDVPVPLQGAYVASKHAVKGFTDTLRIELARRNAPISVTLIKPGSIDTPFTEHARNHLPRAPITPPPRYAPHNVAEAILHACENPVRDMYVGGGAPAMALMRQLAPGLYDWLSRRFLYEAQMTDRPPNSDADMRDNLYAPKADGAERGRVTDGSVKETSLYTQMRLHPVLSWTLLGGAALVASRLASGRQTRRLPRAGLPWVGDG
jgi:short-subunit dehydrogenase